MPSTPSNPTADDPLAQNLLDSFATSIERLETRLSGLEAACQNSLPALASSQEQREEHAELRALVDDLGGGLSALAAEVDQMTKRPKRPSVLEFSLPEYSGLNSSGEKIRNPAREYSLPVGSLLGWHWESIEERGGQVRTYVLTLVTAAGTLNAHLPADTKGTIQAKLCEAFGSHAEPIISADDVRRAQAGA